MPRVVASRELLAPREDVWRFLAEPFHLSDWWPGVVGVKPDRRGLAAGARWQLVAGPQAGGIVGMFLRRPEVTGTLLVEEVLGNELVRFVFVHDRIHAELRLRPAGDSRTRATLAIEGPWLRVNRALPRQALNRLHALCQTAAEL
ncbi:MAG: SRPBCC family protein [Gaiellaceae bacterium]